MTVPSRTQYSIQNRILVRPPAIAPDVGVPFASKTGNLGYAVQHPAQRQQHN